MSRYILKWERHLDMYVYEPSFVLCPRLVQQMHTFDVYWHRLQKVYMRVGGSPTRITKSFDLVFALLSNEWPSQVPR